MLYYLYFFVFLEAFFCTVALYQMSIGAIKLVKTLMKTFKGSGTHFIDCFQCCELPPSVWICVGFSANKPTANLLHIAVVNMFGNASDSM
jgi:hypothetical protein